MNSLNLTLTNSMNAISLLLIFVTTIFSMKYEKIEEYTTEYVEKDKPKHKEHQKEKFKKALIFQWSPVILFNLVCVYLMIPLVIKIIKNSYFSLFNFDFIPTAFILIWIILLIFFAFSVKIAVKLLSQIKKCN